MSETKRHEENNRPKFFAELKRHENEFAPYTEHETTTTQLTGSLDSELKDEIGTTYAPTETLSTLVTKSDRENLIEIQSEIMALYEKPASSQAFTSFGFNSTASDQKSLLPETIDYSETCAERYPTSDLPSASIIITFFNEHWTTLWAAAQKISSVTFPVNWRLVKFNLYY